MNVYKINDVISCEFLKIPKSLFANEVYKALSSDAKLTYALLYDRLSLSKLNNWINDNDEVFLIYKREDIADDLGITYKKAIAAFRELVNAGLICEQRCGRGMPNRIYITKPEITAEDTKKYVKRENTRTAISEYQEKAEGFKNCPNGISEHASDDRDMPDKDIRNFRTGTSRTAYAEYQELPDRHMKNKTDSNKTYNNHTDSSQSVRGIITVRNSTHSDNQTDDQGIFERILTNCELETFEPEERRILYDALERLFYTTSFKIGDAVLPQNKVRSRMYELDASILRSALDKLHTNDRQIKNITGYIMSTIFNCITEEYSLLHVDPFLNSMRRKE